MTTKKALAILGGEYTHVSVPRRKALGSKTYGRGGSQYGWNAGCACGWEQHSNESKRYAESLWRDHVKALACKATHAPAEAVCPKCGSYHAQNAK